MVEVAAADFFEARVTEVLGEKLRVQSILGKQTRLVASGDAYHLPPRGPAPSTGYAICRIADAQWIGCRIDSASAERLTATDANGRVRELGASEVLSPTPVTDLNLRHAFERGARRIEFATAVQRAGRPRAPAGWRPSPRERVLARDGNAWYAAKIHEIEDERLHVAWKADDRVTELAKSEVVPEPPHGGAITRGAIVLVRPEAEAGAWLPLRVQSTGTEIVVENAAGDRRSVTKIDVVPLSP